MTPTEQAAADAAYQDATGDASRDARIAFDLETDELRGALRESFRAQLVQFDLDRLAQRP